MKSDDKLKFNLLDDSVHQIIRKESWDKCAMHSKINLQEINKFLTSSAKLVLLVLNTDTV